jgi:LL-diaminopimelate aminotransferase
MNYSQRYQNIPPYLFFKLEEQVSEMRRKGVDVINLGIGDPDLPPPKSLTDAIKKHIDESDTHFYSTSRGELQVRQGIAEWFKGRFGAELDPASEVAVTIGSKEALANFSRAYVNPADFVGVPDPGYPVYANSATILNDANVKYIPLLKENGFLPRFEDCEGVKLLFLNYPNNPTGAVADDTWWWKMGDWADSHPETVVVHDDAYSEMTFGDYHAPSLLQYTKNCIEFHSLSKLFNCTGYRIGFAVGRKDYIEGLVKIKSQLDSGAPLIMQRAMVDCLKTYKGAIPPKEVLEFRTIYSRRRKIVEEGLIKLGYIVHISPATFYIWFDTGMDDMAFLDKILEVGVVCTPGSGFGMKGKGYARITATVPENRLEESIARLDRI